MMGIGPVPEQRENGGVIKCQEYRLNGRSRQARAMKRAVTSIAAGKGQEQPKNFSKNGEKINGGTRCRGNS